MTKILFVEDDVLIASGLVYALEQEGYDIKHAKSVAEAKILIISEEFDLAILDMQLPDGTGFDVSNELVKKHTDVLFLTVVDDEANTVRAFETGAQDYITKPFRLKELLARIKRILNNQKGIEKPSILFLGNTRIDTIAGKVYQEDNLLDLTALEYRLLLTFVTNKGVMLTRNQILEHIWDSTGNYVEDNTLTVYIKRLREKLGNSVDIETIRGIGYRAN